MRTDYAFFGIMFLVALGAVAVVPVLNGLLGPKKANKAKRETYECGMETVGDAWVQFRVQYYIFALVFVLFDVGGVMLFPFALAYNQVGLWAVMVAVLFSLTLLAALLYAWRKGVLEWD